MPSASGKTVSAEITAGADGMVEVQYLARSPIRFHGQNTGSLYQFSAAAPIQKVHASDLAALARSRFFQIRQSGR